MKTRLIFVRHAEAHGNCIREFHGWTDSDITQKGRDQAALAAKRFKDIHVDVIYSSSLKRTMETASYISKVCDLPVIPSYGLREIYGGDWECQRFEDLPNTWPAEHDTWENKPHLHKMPNGESMVEFRNRLMDEVNKIIASNRGKDICIVTHGTAIRVLMTWFYGFGLESMIDIMWYDNTAITIVDYENQSFNIVIEGDATHLGNELSTLQNQEWWQDYQKRMKEKKRNL